MKEYEEPYLDALDSFEHKREIPMLLYPWYIVPYEPMKISRGQETKNGLL